MHPVQYCGLKPHEAFCDYLFDGFILDKNGQDFSNTHVSVTCRHSSDARHNGRKSCHGYYYYAAITDSLYMSLNHLCYHIDKSAGFVKLWHLFPKVFNLHIDINGDVHSASYNINDTGVRGIGRVSEYLTSTRAINQQQVECVAIATVTTVKDTCAGCVQVSPFVICQSMISK